MGLRIKAVFYALLFLEKKRKEPKFVKVNVYNLERINLHPKILKTPEEMLFTKRMLNGQLLQNSRYGGWPVVAWFQAQ
jgi:hypothetical protein